MRVPRRACASFKHINNVCAELARACVNAARVSELCPRGLRLFHIVVSAKGMRAHACCTRRSLSALACREIECEQSRYREHAHVYCVCGICYRGIVLCAAVRDHTTYMEMCVCLLCVFKVLWDQRRAQLQHL